MSDYLNGRQTGEGTAGRNNNNYGWDAFFPPAPQKPDKPDPEQVAAMDRFRQLLNPAPAPTTEASPDNTYFSTTKTSPAVDPYLNQPDYVPNPAGASYTPLTSGIGKPNGLDPLPGIVTPGTTPALTPAWAPQPAPWLSKGRSRFVDAAAKILKAVQCAEVIDEDLFQGGNAFAGAVEADHAERFHSLVDGDLAHFARAGAGDDEFADLVGDGHGFDDGHAAGVTGIFAAVAAASAVKLHAVEHGGINAQVLEHFVRIGHRFLAMRTDAAHEALRAGQNHGGRNQKRRDAHVVQARDGAGRVIAVHRAKAPGGR